MPLNGHEYLTRQGWQGKGSGLRHGAISRPIIVAQKKNMSGIGKDRDEAFPFWDHVFDAAASAIRVKCYDSDSEDTEPSTLTVAFQKTKTGIISNRRPVTGTPALSGTATPNEEPVISSSGTSSPRLSVMATAKQQAARRMLYSMFFRGPVLGTDIVEEKVESLVEVVRSEERVDVPVDDANVQEEKRKKGKKDKEKKERRREMSAEDEKGDVEVGCSKGKAEAEYIREGLRRSHETKQNKRDEEESEKKGKKRRRSDEEDDDKEEREALRVRRLERAEKKRVKAEKRARKEDKRQLKEEQRRKGEGVALEEEAEAEEKVAEMEISKAHPEAKDDSAALANRGLERRRKGDEDSASKSKKRKTKELGTIGA